MMWQVAGIFLLLSAIGVLAGDSVQWDRPSQKILTAHSDDHALSTLNFSSPSPLIFHSTFALLQQWANNFHPNGHTIAAGTIRKNTNLYHARNDGKLPPSPEWLAFDPEMSYAILGFGPSSHMLTYRTIRAIQVIYFDGASAALYPEGTMDSQMLFLRNDSAHMPEDPVFDPPPNPCPFDPDAERGNCTDWNPLQAEYSRASSLCRYITDNYLGGFGWGYEGIVRMNTGFEVIWCNFSSPSLRLVSHVNISTPEITDIGHSSESNFGPLFNFADSEILRRKRNGSPLPSAIERIPWPMIHHPFAFSAQNRWLIAAAKRYGFAGGSFGRGEARVKLDTCQLFSFYDPYMADQERARVSEEASNYNLTSDGYWKSPCDQVERSEGLRKLGRRRREQRAMNVSAADGGFMKTEVTNRLRDALSQASDGCSGIDWITTAQEIVMAYSTELHELRGLLRSFSSLNSGEALRHLLTRTRHLLHSLVSPFYAYPPYTKENASLAFDVSAPESTTALHLCGTQQQPVDSRLTSSEETTYKAIADVQSAICGTIIPIFLSTEATWYVHFNNFSAPLPDNITHRSIISATTTWLHAVETLMAWLGWVEQWVECDPACLEGEYCYVPTWPVSLRVLNGSRRAGNVAWQVEEMFTKPVCVSGEGLVTGFEDRA